MIQIVAFYFDYEGAKYIHVLKVLIWDNGGCWMFLILILIWSLVIDTPIFRILALYLDFEGAKNNNVL